MTVLLALALLPPLAVAGATLAASPETAGRLVRLAAAVASVAWAAVAILGEGQAVGRFRAHPAGAVAACGAALALATASPGGRRASLVASALAVTAAGAGLAAGLGDGSAVPLVVGLAAAGAAVLAGAGRGGVVLPLSAAAGVALVAAGVARLHAAEGTWRLPSALHGSFDGAALPDGLGALPGGPAALVVAGALLVVVAAAWRPGEPPSVLLAPALVVAVSAVPFARPDDLAVGAAVPAVTGVVAAVAALALAAAWWGRGPLALALLAVAAAAGPAAPVAAAALLGAGAVLAAVLAPVTPTGRQRAVLVLLGVPGMAALVPVLLAEGGTASALLAAALAGVAALLAWRGAAGAGAGTGAAGAPPSPPSRQPCSRPGSSSPPAHGAGPAPGPPPSTRTAPAPSGRWPRAWPPSWWPRSSPGAARPALPLDDRRARRPAHYPSAPSASGRRPAMPATTSKRAPRGRGKGARRSRPSWAWRYRRLLFLAGLLAVGGAGGVAYVLVRVPLPPAAFAPQTTFLYDAHGRPVALLHSDQDRVPVSLDQVPEVVQQAVIAAEDRNFFRHSGVDPVGIARATWNDVRNRSGLQGGSTITQQYVKNAYVGRERSLWRKVREAVIAVKLERELDKRTILERYLNSIYLGRGAYGVQAGAKVYFGKDVGQLDLREAAYLAGLIRGPELADSARHPKVAAERRDKVLRSMEEEGYITAAERRAVALVPVESYVQRRATRAGSEVTEQGIGSEYFVEYVRRYLSAKYGDRAVYGGGLRVHTSLDLEMQREAYEAVTGVLDRPDDPAAALVALDEQGHVRAMVGGRDFASRKVNYAVGSDGGGAGRQAGSAFKPMVLATAVAEGYTVESSFPAPATIVLPRADNGKDWPVDNYDGESFAGPVNLVQATAGSVNTVYAQLVTALGPEKVVDMARRLGVRSPLSAVPSITLGTPNVSVLEMADAYLTFATRGVQMEPIVVTKVTTADGNVLEENRPRGTRVLEPEQADVVTFCLRQVVEHGTGTGARFGKPVAGKTGTTQKYGDAWFVGYTPTLVTAVWMGYPEGQARAMTNVHGRQVTGGSFPATIFRRFMQKATEGTDTGDFRTPKSFPGRVLNEKVDFVDPNATTTSAPPETTTTAAADAATTTSAPPEGPTTTAPEATTTVPPPTTAGSQSGPGTPRPEAP